MPSQIEKYDVVILGAGLAGLSLARQLLMYTDRTVLLLDKLENPPGKNQKVGESLVQLAGYYFSKILDLEYHLLKHDEGLFFALENSGQIKRLIGEAEIIHAVQHPPASSRAYLRGRSVLKFAREMKTAQWDNLVFKVGDQMYRLDMSQAFPGLRLEEMIVAMDKSKTIQDLIRELNLKPV